MNKKTSRRWKILLPNERDAMRCYKVLNRIFKDSIVTLARDKVFVYSTSTTVNKWVHFAAKKYGGKAHIFHF